MWLEKKNSKNVLPFSSYTDVHEPLLSVKKEINWNHFKFCILTLLVREREPTFTNIKLALGLMHIFIRLFLRLCNHN